MTSAVSAANKTLELILKVKGVTDPMNSPEVKEWLDKQAAKVQQCCSTCRALFTT
jgi:hypothetical protein